jgi:hypothetical protein
MTVMGTGATNANTSRQKVRVSRVRGDGGREISSVAAADRKRVVDI